MWGISVPLIEIAITRPLECLQSSFINQEHGFSLIRQFPKCFSSIYFPTCFRIICRKRSFFKKCMSNSVWKGRKGLLWFMGFWRGLKGKKWQITKLYGFPWFITYRYTQEHRIAWGQIFLSEILQSEISKAIGFNKAHKSK